MKTKANKTTQDHQTDFSEKIKAFNEITDPVQNAELGMRLADDMYVAKQNRLKQRLGFLYPFYYFCHCLFYNIRRLSR